MCGGARGAARGGRGHTYYVINPRPRPALPRRGAPPPARAPLPAPRGPRAGRAVLAPGFLVPAPHGHSLRTGSAGRSAAAAARRRQSRCDPRHSRTSLAPPPRSCDIIHANLRPLIFLPSDRSETAAISRVLNVVWTSQSCTFPPEYARAHGTSSRTAPADAISDRVS